MSNKKREGQGKEDPLGHGQFEHAFADVGGGNLGRQAGAMSVAAIRSALYAETCELAQCRGDGS